MKVSALGKKHVIILRVILQQAKHLPYIDIFLLIVPPNSGWAPYFKFSISLLIWEQQFILLNFELVKVVAFNLFPPMSHFLAKHTRKETHGETSEPCIEPLEISHFYISEQYDPITIIQIIMENWSQISAFTYSLRK